MSERPSLNEFVVDGERRELKNPDGPATPRQLARLNSEGRLLLRDEPGDPISKGEAAWAIEAEDSDVEPGQWVVC